MTKFHKVILALVIANILYGVSYPIFKWTFEVIPPITFLFLRFLGASILIFPFVYKRLALSRKDFGILFIVAIIDGIIAHVLIYYGLQLAPSVNASVITSVWPILLIFVSVIFLKEKFSKKVLAGTLISFVGVIIIIARPFLEQNTSGESMLGNVLLLLSVLTIPITLILFKKVTNHNEPLPLAFWYMLMTAILVIPIVFLEIYNLNFNIDFNLQALVGILFGILFIGVISNYLDIYGFKFINTSEYGVFSYIVPVAAIFVAIPLLGESITVVYIIGSLLVFSGIFISENHIHHIRRLHTHLFKKK